LHRRKKILFIGEKAVHSFLGKLVRRETSLCSEMLQPLFLPGFELNRHIQTTCDLKICVNPLWMDKRTRRAASLDSQSHPSQQPLLDLLLRWFS
jgi:hypothetical protein